MILKSEGNEWKQLELKWIQHFCVLEKLDKQTKNMLRKSSGIRLSPKTTDLLKTALSFKTGVVKSKKAICVCCHMDG